MSFGEALFKIRRFLEEHGADEETMKAWEYLRDEITKTIGAILKMNG